METQQTTEKPHNTNEWTDLDSYRYILSRTTQHIAFLRKSLDEKSASCKAQDTHIKERNVVLVFLHRLILGRSNLVDIETPLVVETNEVAVHDNNESSNIPIENMSFEECKQLEVKLLLELGNVKQRIAFRNVLIERQRNIFEQQANLISKVNIDLINFAWSGVMSWVQNKGIANNYSICYASAVLQVFFHIPQLVHWFLNFSLENQNNVTQYLPIHETVKLLRKLRSGDVGDVLPLLQSIPEFLTKYELGEQHDSAEFLLTFQELFQNQLKSNSPFPAFFNFGIENVLTCCDCYYTSTTLLWESAIELHLPNDSDIESLLIEQLCREKVELRCPDCKEQTEFSKRLTLTEFPQILTIKLKRLIPIDHFTARKNNTKIVIPTFLDLSIFNVVPSNPKYKLSSMIHHYPLRGQSAHYVSIIWSPVKKQWIKYSDDNVPEIYNFNEMDLSHPYILFYKRCSVSECNEFDVDFYSEEPNQSNDVFSFFHGDQQCDPNADSQHQFPDPYGDFMGCSSEDEEADEHIVGKPQVAQVSQATRHFQISQAENQEQKSQFYMSATDEEEEPDKEDQQSEFSISETDEEDEPSRLCKRKQVLYDSDSDDKPCHSLVSDKSRDGEVSHHSQASGNNVQRQQSQVEKESNEEERHIGTSRNLPRQCKRKQVICDSDSDEPYPPSEPSFHPSQESADELNQSMHSISKLSPFRRHSPTRISPTNVKKFVRTENNSPVPVDKLSNLNLTQLQHKKLQKPVDQQEQPPSTSFANADEVIVAVKRETALFTAEQEAQIQQLVDEARGIRHSLPGPERRVILDNINSDFQLNVSDLQFQRWISKVSIRKKRKNDQPPVYTKEQLTLISQLRASIPKTHWVEIQQILANKFARFKGVNCSTICKIYGYHMTSTVKGEWSADDEQLLLAKYTMHGRNWSLYKIPGRSPEQIKRKFLGLMVKTLKQLNGKPFSTTAMDAFETILKEKGVDSTVSSEEWFHELCKYTNLHGISIAITEFAFSYIVSQLAARIQVLRTNNGFQKPPPLQQREYLLKQSKRAKRQPFGLPLNNEQVKHIHKLMDQAKEHGKLNRKFQWYEDRSLKVIATTTTLADDSRRLDFRPIGSCFKEDEDRKCVTNLLFGDEDEESEEEEDEAQQEHHGNVHINELIDVRGEKAKHGINILGALRLKPSLKYPQVSAKRLLFFTSYTNVYEHIYNQLAAVPRRVGCPSWYDAFAKHQLDIDWTIIDTLAYTEGATAGMRLKLTTVKLAPKSVFNIRTTVFCTLVDGREEYFDRLRELNFLLNDEAISVNEGDAIASEESKTKPKTKPRKNRK